MSAAAPKKECRGCGNLLPHDYFYRTSRGGIAGKCKECTARAVRENRKKKIGYYRAYDRARGNRQDREDTRRYRQLNAQKYKATNAVNNAIRDGKLTKPSTCSECGSTGRIHGHHDDYAKPLEVRWLCPVCHKAWHSENGEGLNAGVSN
jgi:hypothetical protein